MYQVSVMVIGLSPPSALGTRFLLHTSCVKAQGKLCCLCPASRSPVASSPML